MLVTLPFPNHFDSVKQEEIFAAKVDKSGLLGKKLGLCACLPWQIMR